MFERLYFKAFPIIFSLTFLLSADVIEGQVPANLIGNNPSKLKWGKIETDHIKVIYPKDVEDDAQRVARIIQALNSVKSSDKPFLKTSIIMNAQSATSNGFVTVGPFRSEFFPIQRQFSNSTNYLDLLTIHEYQHIVQFSNATRGVTKAVKNILGSWAWGGMMAMAIPRWYYEGDAVIVESEFSKSGRGGLPSFEMQYYALYNDNRNYNYEKAGAGSINDYVPDWYPLGYNMLTYGTDKFGDQLWPSVLDDAVRYKGLFYAFSKSLKRQTGLNPSQLYEESYDYYKEDYENYLASLNLKPAETITQPTRSVVTNYYLPKPDDEGLIYIKSSYDELPHLVLRKAGKENKLTEVGIQLDRNFTTLSKSGPIVAWTQVAFDQRWRYRQLNDIYVYNISNGEKRRLTEGQRYFSPALSNDGQFVAVIHIEDNLRPNIEVLSTFNGDIVEKIPVSEYEQIAHPIWIDQDRLAVVVTKDQFSYIALYNLKSKTWQELTAPSYEQLSHPTHSKGYIYFSASYTRINNIYRVNIETLDLEKVSETSIGAFQPAVDDKKDALYYSELTADGYRIRKIDFELNPPLKFDIENKVSDKSDSHVINADQLLSNLPDTTYESKKFNKLSGIFNFHSILPEFSPPETRISILSDNAFSTLSSELGAEFNSNENEWSYHFALTYAELFPVINFNYVHGHRNAQFLNFSTATDTSAVFTDYIQEWSEDRISLGVTLPLNFSSGNLNTRFSLFSRFQYAHLNVISNFDNEDNASIEIPLTSQVRDLISNPIGDANITSLDFGFRFIALKRMTQRQLHPRFGVDVFFRKRDQIGKELLGGDVTNVRAAAYLPGLAKTHSLYFTLGTQSERALDNYRFSDGFIYPRGYDFSLRRDDFFKIGVNYSFPLFYPDAAIGGFAFVKRVKANLFYDHGVFGFSTPPLNSQSFKLRSVGCELGFDFRAFRLVEVDMGLRYSYLLDTELLGDINKHQFDFFVISITQ